jgi:hypothetical protein
MQMQSGGTPLAIITVQDECSSKSAVLVTQAMPTLSWHWTVITFATVFISTGQGMSNVIRAEHSHDQHGVETG